MEKYHGEGDGRGKRFESSDRGLHMEENSYVEMEMHSDQAADSTRDRVINAELAASR